MAFILSRLDDFFQFIIWGAVPNETCRKHFNKILPNVIAFKPWAVHMLDSTAKIPSGLLYGNTVQMGNMGECLDVDVNEEFGSFVGKHCMVEFNISVITSQPNETNLPYFWGVCIPSSCSASDLQHFLRRTMQLPATVEEVLCHTANQEVPLRIHELATIGVTALILLLTLLSTAFDYATSKSPKNPYLTSFSIRTNMRNLLDTKTPTGYIRVLDGLRVCALFGIMLTHVYSIYALVGPGVNRIIIRTWQSDWEHVWLTSRCVSFDTFFVLAGLLVSYWVMSDKEKGKNMNIPVYYVYRYLRTAPTVAFVLLWTATLFNRMGSAPFYKLASQEIEEQCQENWWWYVIFIYNWKEFDKCMGHVWYLAADMQLYWLAPLLLLPLLYRPRLGRPWMFFVLAVVFCASFGISYGMKEKVDIYRSISDSQQVLLYEATYQRATPWLIGFISGYYLHKYRKHTSLLNNENKSNSSTKPLLGIGAWIIILIMGCGVMVAVHPFIQPEYNEVYNETESAIYLALYHVMWALVVVLFILVCVTGYGGMFNAFFASKFFVPLSRLSFSAYVVHFGVIERHVADAYSSISFSDYDMILQTVFIIVLSLLYGLLIYLMVEQPVVVLVSLLLKRDKRREVEEPVPLPGTSSEAATLPHRGSLRSNVNSTFEMTERKHEASP